MTRYTEKPLDLDEARRRWRWDLMEAADRDVPYATDPTNPWARCACGDLWLFHDVSEYSGDGSEMCCVHGCDQVGCPGRGDRS